MMVERSKCTFSKEIVRSQQELIGLGCVETISGGLKKYESSVQMVKFLFGALQQLSATGSVCTINSPLKYPRIWSERNITTCGNSADCVSNYVSYKMVFVIERLANIS